MLPAPSAPQNPDIVRRSRTIYGDFSRQVLKIGCFPRRVVDTMSRSTCLHSRLRRSGFPSSNTTDGGRTTVGRGIQRHAMSPPAGAIRCAFAIRRTVPEFTTVTTSQLSPSYDQTASTFKVVKRAVTLPPTVRRLSSGVPNPTLVNLAAVGGGGHHGHGHSGPRSNVRPKWSGGLQDFFQSLLKDFCDMYEDFYLFFRRSVTLTAAPSAPVNTFSQQRYIHTCTPAKDAPNVPDFSGCQAASLSTNRAPQYFMIGSLDVLSASVAKSSVTEFLSTMAASADVLAMAKVEVELASVPEGKDAIIEWRGKPVFIRHGIPDKIEEAKGADWKILCDPESDENRTKSALIWVRPHRRGRRFRWLVCYF